MGFNLNDSKYEGGSSVFNNGIPGKIENVEITVEKRKADEPDTYPPYKLIVNDGSGAAPLTTGFYTEEQDEKRQDMNIQRVKSIAKAVVPKDFVYPSVSSYEEAINSLFKIIKDNCEGKKVNVFASYGYANKPSKYLGLRFFNFIESVDETFSRLKVTPNDVMVRPVEDAPVADTPLTSAGSGW